LYSGYLVILKFLIFCHLITLERCPGVCPIGIGEALWQILCKVIVLATRTDLEEVCGITPTVVLWFAGWHGGGNLCCA